MSDGFDYSNPRPTRDQILSQPGAVTSLPERAPFWEYKSARIYAADGKVHTVILAKPYDGTVVWFYNAEEPWDSLWVYRSTGGYDFYAGNRWAWDNQISQPEYMKQYQARKRQRREHK